MAIFKCKMCGGTIEFNQGDTVGICDSCGTKQTLPKLDDDKKANLYDRANHFRRNNDYDKAMGIYEQILNEDNTDSEAYWSLVLCRYGIEYVEDPATHKRVPTVNRAQFTSIFDDDNYKQAIHYADSSQRVIYEQEATLINEIQKGILAISQKEEPFDVFICYKETDNNGRRTQDSVLANDLYHQLTQEGFKVFFSRITLEDKLGTAYEPYIFAALNSAKVMVVIGTRPENFNAVWVKNEWSRFLALVKNDSSKVLIPAYRDMDPYDLPEEFSHLQAQDMSKLGFMQDLIRGIKKILNTGSGKEIVKETVVVNGNAVTDTAPLLKRAFMFLEDGNWSEADAYCEKVLDIEPENAKAYLGKLMAEYKISRQGMLAGCNENFKISSNYEKVMRFGDEKQKVELEEYFNTSVYNRAKDMMQAASSEKEYEAVAREFEKILDFKDSKVLVEECHKKAEACHKDRIYEDAILLMSKNTIPGYEEAIKTFRGISDWKDADSQIDVCQEKIEELKAKKEAEKIAQEKAKAKKIKIIKIAIPIACVCIAFVVVLTTVIIPNVKYNNATAMIEEGKYLEAYEVMKDLDGYKDSADKMQEVYAKYTQEQLKGANVGTHFFFGSYEQDNDTSNGKEDIEWQVLEKQEDKVLVISTYGLDCQPYNDEDESVTWENCTLRSWLNDEFIKTAFSKDEQKLVAEANLKNADNSKYGTDGGKDTVDKVFLLSIDEAKKYFSADADRICRPTEYAEAQGVWLEDDVNCWWRLRSPGKEQNLSTSISYEGSVNISGGDVDNDYGANRPALWINLK